MFRDPLGARPGGTPFVHAGALVLPVQGCRGGYGTSLRLLRVDALSPERVAMSVTDTLTAPAAAAPFAQGCHTLAAAGAVTLIDVKQVAPSAKALLLRPFRQLHRRARAAAPLGW